MIEYGCPDCGRRAFDAASVVPVRIEWVCRDHGKVDVVPRHSVKGVPTQRTLMCTECQRMQFIERPVNDITYCVACGTPTLIIVAELPAVEGPGPKSRVGFGKRPVEAHAMRDE